ASTHCSIPRDEPLRRRSVRDFRDHEMTASRKHPSVAFWITTMLVVGLEAYPLSWGPVGWLEAHGWLTEQTLDLAASLYFPMRWARFNAPDPISSALDWYVTLWAAVP